jgi:hypothetical protein
MAVDVAVWEKSIDGPGGSSAVRVTDDCVTDDSSSSVERVDASHRPEVAWREVSFDEHYLADVWFPAELGSSPFVGPGGLFPQDEEVFTGESVP